MNWVILGFGFILLCLIGFMVAAGFHVAKFRYVHDASIPIFSLLATIFILSTALTFIMFRYTPSTTGDNTPSQTGIEPTAL